jgi:hypothetical protein
MYFVGLQILTAVSMKMAALWDIVPCNLVEVEEVLEVRTASIIKAISP